MERKARHGAKTTRRTRGAVLGAEHRSGSNGHGSNNGHHTQEGRPVRYYGELPAGVVRPERRHHEQAPVAAPARVDGVVSPALFADRGRALALTRTPDGRQRYNADAVGLRNGDFAAASAEPRNSTREIFDTMVGNRRDGVLAAAQVETGELFSQIKKDTLADKSLAVLEESGLVARELKALDNLFETVFHAVGEGVASSYLADGDVLLSSSHIENLALTFSSEADGITRPDGAIVDENGEVVMLYAIRSSSERRAVTEAITGMREFATQLQASGIPAHDVDLVLISPPLEEGLVLDQDVDHSPVNLTMGDVLAFVQNKVAAGHSSGN